jgi:hypothetical protein
MVLRLTTGSSRPTFQRRQGSGNEWLPTRVRQCLETKEPRTTLVYAQPPPHRLSRTVLRRGALASHGVHCALGVLCKYSCQAVLWHRLARARCSRHRMPKWRRGIAATITLQPAMPVGAAFRVACHYAWRIRYRTLASFTAFTPSRGFCMQLVM